MGKPIEQAPTTDWDWVEWHRAYDEAGSPLALRLEAVRESIRWTLDCLPAGPIRAISVCAGQGRDITDAVAGHARQRDVSARLVELDPRNTQLARASAQAASLDDFEIVTGDASLTDAYLGAVPAQLLLVSGVFGNISDPDIHQTIDTLPSLAAPGAMVIWTRNRHDPDVTVHIRRWFSEAGFEEVAFTPLPGCYQTVGVHRLTGPARPLRPGVKLFDFVGYDRLRQAQR